MREIFRIIIDDNQRIINEDEMMEEIYDKLDELIYKVNRLIRTAEENSKIKF